MNDIQRQYQELRQAEHDRRKEERAGKTLLYYDKITYMIASDEYENEESFLYLVQQFIEENEYISDKQMEVVDRIYNDGYDRETIPF